MTNHRRDDEEIDVVEQLRRLWLCRRLIIGVTLLSMAIGCVVAFALPKEYEAACEVVPQATPSTSLRRMSSLAALAGIDLRDMHEESMLSPYLYENIFYSVRFGKELLQARLRSERYAEPVSLFDYIIGRRYVGDEVAADSLSQVRFDEVSRADYAALRELHERVRLTLNSDTGLLTITALMPEPIVAAEVVELALEQLQRYITRMKIEKVQSNLDFITEQYHASRRRFEEAQSRRARFRDTNHNTTRYAALSELETLDAEYSLALNLYKELSMQMEQAKIKVSETMPILTVVSPVSVPFRKNKPRRLIIITTFVVAGIVVGSCAVLALPSVAEITGCRSLLRFLPKEVVGRSEEEPISTNQKI